MSTFEQELYRGRFDNVPTHKSKSIRVFISSTFSDTIDERNILIETVYPKLKDYCHKAYGFEFQYSDMRWGVQDIASDDHSTIDVCLQELDRCCKLSLATNCIILLSHRYGSRMLPAIISKHIFDPLREAATADNNFLLDEWYQLDENPLEPVYVLQPISSILPSHDEQQNWNKIQETMLTLLRKAANICLQQKTITQDEHDDFFISVTAKEIYRAIINNKTAHQTNRILCFMRDIIDIEDHLSDKHVWKYTELEQEPKQLLDELKKVLQTTLDPSNIKIFKVKWANLKNRENYLQYFADEFYATLKTQIDQYLLQPQNQVKQSLTDSLDAEILEHAIECKTLVSRFYERNDILEKIKHFIQSNETRPCVIYGESGCGKSSIMAKVAIQASQWYSNPSSVSVIIRFFGFTPSSSDIRKPLLNVTQQIIKIFGIVNIQIRDGDSQQLKEQLERVAELIPLDKQLVLLFDSIDQLQITDCDCKWLPLSFPSNVKCILSTIPKIEANDKEIDILLALKDLLNDEPHLFVEIPKLGKQTALDTFDSWLKKDKRRLTSIQNKWVKDRMDQLYSLTPLVLSLIYDLTLSWHSYDKKINKEFNSIKQTRDAIKYLYDTMGTKHGEVLFRRSMRYIQLFGGVSKNELEDVLSIDDDVLQSVFQHYLPPINVFRLPGTLWTRIQNDLNKYLVERDIDGIPCIYFYHRSFQEYKPKDVGKLVLDTNEQALLEKNRIELYADCWNGGPLKPYQVLSKLVEKYHLSVSTIQTNRVVSSQGPLILDRKKKLYNKRKIDQLISNIARYEAAHPHTIYNYTFMRAYLSYY
ncbi:unnamed protein product, partial [Didymodactylos carnosus]